MKISLPIDWKYERSGWKVVEAEIMGVAPQFSHIATFAVHKYPEPWRMKWAVSNVETGFCVKGGNTKKEAVAQAALLLSMKSAQQVVIALNKSKGKTKP